MAGKRKGKHRSSHGGGHGEGGDERWLITYADMITLLMIFFIVMYSMANTDLKKFAQVAISLKKGFNMPVNELAVFGTGTGSLLDQGGMSVGQPSPLVIQSLPQQQQDFIALSEALAKLAQEETLAGSVSVNMSPRGIVITLPAALLFEPGSATLQEKAKTIVDKVAEVLRPLPNKIRVEGHTDNMPTNSPLYPTNWELSTARAVSVVRYLIDYGHLQPERLEAAGMGEYRPLVPNDTRSHRAMNRRADIVVLYPAGGDDSSLPALEFEKALGQPAISAAQSTPTLPRK
jgi:chemotaxis protein MotB